MVDQVNIFDRSHQRLKRDRAALQKGDHTFLLERVAEDFVDRLSLINRDFPVAADLNCHGGIFSKTLAQSSVARKIKLLINSDLSLDMARQAPSPQIVLDEGTLPFQSESLNLITSLLTLQSVNDLPGALIQIRRALKPDGLFIGALFCGNTLTELRQSLLKAEEECEGGVSPRIAPFADLQTLGGLLQRAGFALPVADVETVPVTYSHPLKLFADLRAMGQTNTLCDRRKGFSRRTTLMRACQIYQEEFGNEEGRIPATFEIATLTGWAPHDSQQKPLRPGSAEISLADIFGKES